MKLKSVLLCSLLVSGVALTPVQAKELTAAQKSERKQKIAYIQASAWGYLALFLGGAATAATVLTPAFAAACIINPKNDKQAQICPRPFSGTASLIAAGASVGLWYAWWLTLGKARRKLAQSIKPDILPTEEPQVVEVAQESTEITEQA